MKAGSMEGLIGASVNLKLTRTPMRVYKEAERKGDTDTKMYSSEGKPILLESGVFFVDAKIGE